MQNEWAGAQAFSSFDTYLAPFVRTDQLSYNEVKHCIESFVFGVNTPSRCLLYTSLLLSFLSSPLSSYTRVGESGHITLAPELP